MSCGMNNVNDNNGPCGACKFLRRKCVKGCIFAPYFDPEQGTVQFAAVHKVFGASNASKLLLRIPANQRHHAAVTLSYEAWARVRDPVYGCVSHIFSLQQQVVNLQAELAYIQARISTMQWVPLPHPAENHSQAGTVSSSEMGSKNSNLSNIQIDDRGQQQFLSSSEMAYNTNENVHLDPQLENCDFVHRYFP